MLPSRADRRPFLGPWRGLASLALLAVAPKCALCLISWLGLAAALGLAGPEICGALAPVANAGPIALVGGGLLAAGAGGRALLRSRR